MKPKHVAAFRDNARAILSNANISIGQSFDTLKQDQIDNLKSGAGHQWSNRNGFRARSYYEFLQRQAR